MQNCSTPQRYGLAVGLTLLALFVTRIFPPLLNEGIFILPLAAIVLTAWYGGRGPGLLATLISGLGINYFFFPTVNSLITLLEDAASLIVFGAIAVGLIEFSEARKRDQQALHDSQARWNAVFEHNPTMYFMVEPGGTILSVNAFGAEKLGYRHDELLGRSLLTFFYEADRQAVQANVSTCLQQPGQVMGGEFRQVRKDGTVQWVRETAKAVQLVRNEPVVLIVCEDITERREAEISLREKAGLLDLTHDSVYVRDLHDVLTYWNRGAEERYGWSSAEAVGKVSHQLTRTVFPAPLEEINEELLGTGRWEGELVHAKRDGTPVVVASRWSLLKDEQGSPIAILETNNDITKRREAEQRLRVQYTVTQILSESARFQEATPRILQALCECQAWEVGALWKVDNEAGLLRCVEVWHTESIEGREFEAGMRATTFMPGIGLPGKVWLSREAVYIPDVLHDANFLAAPIAAREMLHAAIGFPILLGSEILGVAEFFSREIRPPDQDLLNMMATIGSQLGQFIEREGAEEMVQKTQLELAHVARVATLGELTASIAHEINQPLGAIVNNAGACLRWLAAHNLQEAKQSAEQVIQDGHRASQIIRGIRDLVRKTPLQKEWLDINEAIREVLVLVRRELQGYGVTVHTHLSDDVPAILGDRIQLEQVLLNIIMNAIEAMSSAGDGPRRLQVNSEKHDADHLVVTVQDSGPGLDAVHLDRLFQAFFSTKPRGLGMGLAISRSIIEAHGGRLWATPNEDRGAAFRFTVPIGGGKPA